MNSKRRPQRGYAQVSRPLFTIDSGIPIAYISGGNYDGEMLCVDGEADPGAEGSMGRDIGFRESDLEPILNPSERSCAYIAGPSGAGKTTYVADLVANHIEVYPEAEVYLFSRTRGDDDPAFDDLHDAIVQVTLDNQFCEAPFDCTTLKPGTVVIFDDCATIMDDKLRVTVEKCIMDALEVGRKPGVYVILTSHNIVPHGKRSFQHSVINEATDFTVFPGHSSAPELTKVLKDCLGMNAAQIKKIREAKSRWVTIHNRGPKYVLEQHNAYMW